METFYIFIVAVLFVLALSDLMVGVSNDAVNFLNSAIGSKAAPFRVIMLIAAMGVLVGATFSSGMMEVARKGIMNPEQFVFAEIMLIFLAVMMTDVILLDFYNTFGLPTSTTVSIVFELLGASVALATIKMRGLGQPLSEMSTYINSASALLIIFGILISVVIAFLSGAIVQYLARIMFSFNLQKTYKKFGGVFGGLAITAILYFMLIKGAKGTSFMSGENITWIKENTLNILMISFVGWSLILQLLVWFTRFNILKIIVLVGTFSLAMAFAGNDLVNFIGVPLAGLESFKAFLSSDGADPDGLFMSALQGKVQTPTILLVLAGLVMVITLMLSKKARSVTKTTIDLSRQEAGYERFESTGFSRAIVRHTKSINKFTQRIVPNQVLKGIEGRFNRRGLPKTDQISFDLVRASINLVVAAVLIAFGTSLKLPLSTTYVTFMVAMGTSLSDRAWGRESAVYRITGVLVVIMGWFVTAFLAFVSAFIMGYILHYGGLVAILVLVALAIFLLLRSQIIHRRRETKLKNDEEAYQDEIDDTNNLDKRMSHIMEILGGFDNIYKNIINALAQEKRKKLIKINKELDSISKVVKKMKMNIPNTIKTLDELDVEIGQAYIQVVHYLGEATNSLTFMARPALDHIDNNHQELISYQVEDLLEINGLIENQLKSILDVLENRNFEVCADLSIHQDELLEKISQVEKRHLKRIKSGDISTRNSMLYIALLRESRGFVLFTNSLSKSYKNLINPPQ